MTEKEFYDALRVLGLTWRFSSTTASGIRSNVDRPQYQSYVCPLTAVCYAVKGEFYSPENWRCAAEELEIPAGIAGRIADAADYRESPYQEVRGELLKATGLEGGTV